MPGTIPTVELYGMHLAALDVPAVMDHMFAALAQGEGGWLVTANLDFVRRYAQEPEIRGTYEAADLRVADGMPLIWASALKGTRLPERVAGSSMVYPLCQRAAREERSVYLLGGDPDANDAAAARLEREIPGLRIVGRSAPFVASPPTPEQAEELGAELERTQPDIVFVAFGSPKQEHVIAALRERLPGAWWIGVGISLSFLAGHVKRAPRWMQRTGLEWVHRLVQEPRRLFRRYIIEDLPFAFRLLGRSACERVLRR